MMDRDTLRREQEADKNLEKSFSSNPVKKAIQELFHNELSGTKYRKLGLSEIKTLVLEKLTEASKTPGPYSSAVLNLTVKIKKAQSVESILMELNEYLFS